MDEAERDLHRRAAERMATLAALARPVQHELNNLLTVVFANLEMLRRQAEEGAPRRQLGRVEEAARRMEATCRATLSLARRIPGAPAPEEASLAEVVTALRPLLQMLLPGPGALSVALEPEAWPVRLDRPLLDEALLLLAMEHAAVAQRGTGLALSVANRPGGEGQEDRAELVVHLPLPPSPEVQAALGRAAAAAGGALAEAEAGALLRLLLPRAPDAAPG